MYRPNLKYVALPVHEIIITEELIKVTPSQLQTVTGALYNTLSPVTHQRITELQ